MIIMGPVRKNSMEFSLSLSLQKQNRNYQQMIKTYTTYSLMKEGVFNNTMCI